MYEGNIKALLNEEKWTRATLNNYTIPTFQELDTVVTKLENPDDQLEVKATCDEYLQKNRNSIIALYISGSIALKRKTLDYSAFTAVIEVFNENKRWNIVEFLALKVLEVAEDKYVLRIDRKSVV